MQQQALLLKLEAQLHQLLMLTMLKASIPVSSCDLFSLSAFQRFHSAGAVTFDDLLRGEIVRCETPACFLDCLQLPGCCCCQ
jgi:hypothetical protein